MSEVKVFYIGDKPVKKDTVAGTNHVWRGFGSYRLVLEAAAQRLCDFPTVWMSEKDFRELYEEDGADAATGLASLPVVDAPPAQQVAPQPEAADQHDATPIKLIQEAIRKLDRANTEHFGSSGAPKIDAVREQLPEGFELSAKDLNAAFSEIKDEFRV
ncbi:hypothetical protein [Marinobacterium iners]|uniref:Mu-like prophage FluMu N-terminal domain-containing protein n=1 Tax=Marinobacterium iners DSM 11526 TaxID=1122198 RepID=A0A1H3X7K3_9GAMM|nr:hypothetical protein [Marinobacterium iners]SDZ94604.1 hypothetical protein SAMN02745729_10146 [Marinobacterium iners DSM 11526]